MSVYENGSEEAGDSLLSSINIENDPGPRDFLDERVDQNFRTKRDFFENLGNCGKSTETRRRQRSRSEISTSVLAEDATRCTTSTSPSEDIERSQRGMNSPVRDEHMLLKRSYSLTRLNSPATDEHSLFRRSYSRLDLPAIDGLESIMRSYSQTRLKSPARDEHASFRRSYSQTRLKSPARDELVSLLRSESQEQFGMKRVSVKKIPRKRLRKTLDSPLRLDDSFALPVCIHRDPTPRRRKSRRHDWLCYAFSSSEEDSKGARSSSQTKQDRSSSPDEESKRAKSSSQTKQDRTSSSDEESKGAKSQTKLDWRSSSKEESKEAKRSSQTKQDRPSSSDEESKGAKSQTKLVWRSTSKEESKDAKRSNLPLHPRLSRIDEPFRRSYLPLPPRLSRMDEPFRSSSQTKQDRPSSSDEESKGAKSSSQTKLDWRSSSKEESKVAKSSSQTKQDRPSSSDEESKGAKSQTKLVWRSTTKEESKDAKRQLAEDSFFAWSNLPLPPRLSRMDEPFRRSNLPLPPRLSRIDEPFRSSSQTKQDRPSSSDEESKGAKSQTKLVWRSSSKKESKDAKRQLAKDPFFAWSNLPLPPRLSRMDEPFRSSSQTKQDRPRSSDEESKGAKVQTKLVWRSSSKEESKDEKRSYLPLPPRLSRMDEPFRRTFSSDGMQVFQQPMCLVRTEENRLIIDDKTLEQIIKIPWPMVIVAVAGLYRTGKSYLLNLLAGSNKAFAVGNTTKSETKGIWVLCVTHPKKTETVLMLLDTEGLGDIDKGDPNHDNKIFTLATLLCNCLVYNMKGAFDHDAVSKLTCITHMSENIRYRGSTKSEYLNLVLPQLVLCLRDFGFKLVHGGRNITEDEYLEECLKEKNEKGDTFNKPKECIRKYFPVRKCFTFPVPGDGDVIENLETLPFSELSPKFQKAVKPFLSYILDLAPKELLASKPITGQMFKTLATRYLTDVDQGAIPNVDDALRYTAKAENRQIMSNALNLFTGCFSDVELPAPSRHIKAIYTRAERESLQYLRGNVVRDQDGSCEISAQLEMENFWNKLEEDNIMKIREMCDDKLQKESMSFKENITKRIYKVAGGHKLYQRDLNKLKDTFMSDLREFEEHEILLTWYGFLKTLESTETEIVEADEHLSQQEKEDERNIHYEQIKRLNEEHEKRKQEAVEEQRNLLEEHYNKVYMERVEQLRKEEQKYRELINIRLEQEEAIRELMEFKKQQEKKKKKWFFGRLKYVFFNKRNVRN